MFKCRGHADYAEAGHDIVCAAVSMLTFNTANALTELTDSKVKVAAGSELTIEFLEAPDEGGQLLMETMMMGLQDVQKQYGKRFLQLKFEEV